MGDGVQELIDNLGKLAVARQRMGVIIIIHSEMGLEMMSNINDLVLKVGMLDIARVTVMEVQAKMNELHEDKVREMAEKAVAALTAEPGKPN
jgi:hypothetical protein